MALDCSEDQVRSFKGLSMGLAPASHSGSLTHGGIFWSLCFPMCTVNFQ